MKTPNSKRAAVSFGAADIVRRICARDYSIWPDPSPGGGGDWMGWLDLPETLSHDTGIANPQHQRIFANATSLNILGMGGSSLTTEVLRSLFPDTSPQVNVFDTIEPETIAHAVETLDLSTAMFAVASKSGTTSEPLSLEAVFRQSLSNAGIEDTSAHFVAISDADTPLAARANAGQFVAHIETPANVGGRFSALTGFGMFPASICNMPISEMASRATEMAERCKREDASNPGLALGLFMANNAIVGHDKVTIVISPRLERFGLWLEQLLAESTGKNNRGLVPIAGEPMLAREHYGNDRQFVRIALKGDPIPDNPCFDDHPTFSIEIAEPADIAGEFFRWEFAVAVASCAIGVYPFDQPDVESAKVLARKALESDDGVNVEATGINQAMSKIIKKPSPGGYVAIGAFLRETNEMTTQLNRMRAGISRITGMATACGYGPRYLHSTGQLHKGGPTSVTLLAFTDDSYPDVHIPGQDYSLSDLLLSQAAGDVQACREKGRNAELVHLKLDALEEIETVAEILAII